MAKYTIKQVGEMAAKACFYVTPEGQYLRMQWTDMAEALFCATDEDSGEDFLVTFEEVVEEDNPHFEQLTRMEI